VKTYPATYYVGKWVKIHVPEEEKIFWMRVDNVYEGKLVGTLANNPVYPTNKGFGSQHVADKENVVAVWMPTTESRS